MTVTIYDQTCCGKRHFRAMRDDGGRIGTAMMIDYPDQQTAEYCVRWQLAQDGFSAITVQHKRSDIR